MERREGGGGYIRWEMIFTFRRVFSSRLADHRCPQTRKIAYYGWSNAQCDLFGRASHVVSVSSLLSHDIDDENAPTWTSSLGSHPDGLEPEEPVSYP